MINQFMGQRRINHGAKNLWQTIQKFKYKPKHWHVVWLKQSHQPYESLMHAKQRILGVFDTNGTTRTNDKQHQDDTPERAEKLPRLDQVKEVVGDQLLFDKRFRIVSKKSSWSIEVSEIEACLLVLLMERFHHLLVQVDPYAPFHGWLGQMMNSKQRRRPPGHWRRILR